MGDTRVDSILGHLRDGGGRVTRSRRRVIEAMVTTGAHHFTAAEVVAAVRADDPDFQESTVYRTLDRLLELGAVERVQLSPGAAVFHVADRPHHHLVCEHCGSVVEARADLLDAITTEVRREHGFALRPSPVTLAGTCTACLT